MYDATSLFYGDLITLCVHLVWLRVTGYSGYSMLKTSEMSLHFFKKWGHHGTHHAMHNTPDVFQHDNSSLLVYLSSPDYFIYLLPFYSLVRYYDNDRLQVYRIRAAVIYDVCSIYLSLSVYAKVYCILLLIKNKNKDKIKLT